jgi:hypothetical protein
MTMVGPGRRRAARAWQSGPHDVCTRLLAGMRAMGAPRLRRSRGGKVWFSVKAAAPPGAQPSG